MKEFLKLRKWMAILAVSLWTFPAISQEIGDDDEITEIDCSDKIQNHDFVNQYGGFTMDGWTISRRFDSGNVQQCPSAAGCAEYWNPTGSHRNFDFYQELTGLENGKYVLRASMWYRGDDKSCGVYASNDGSVEVFVGCEQTTGANDAAQAANRQEYETPAIVVYDGKLRVGVKNRGIMNSDWFGVDYVKLIKVGNATSDELSRGSANALLTQKMKAATLKSDVGTPAVYETGDTYKGVDYMVYSGDNQKFGADKNVIYYELSGLQRGTYRVSFYASANVSKNTGTVGTGGDNIAQIFANNTARDIPVNDQSKNWDIASGQCATTNYPCVLVAEVGNDGKLTYGIRNIAAGGQLYVLRNISLRKVSTNSDCLCFTSPDYAQICFANVNDNTIHDFQYSIDGEIWEDYTTGIVRDANSTSPGTRPNVNGNWFIDISHNQKAYFRAKGRTGMLSEGNDLKFQNSSHLGYSRYAFYHGAKNGKTVGDIYASGNVMSLIDPYCQSLDVPKTCFSCLFLGMDKLVSSPRLPATELSPWCYEHMFYGCTSLIVGPTIPATVCYDGACSNMFRNCTSLRSLDISFRNDYTETFEMFDGRNTSSSSCVLYCYAKDVNGNQTNWGTKKLNKGNNYQYDFSGKNIQVIYKDDTNMSDWLCLTNIGSENATIKLNNIGADFGIEYSYTGLAGSWHNVQDINLVDKGICPDCHGNKYFTENCETCHGTPTVACTVCTDGRVNCSTCGGDHRVSCGTCGGDHKVSCGTCGGDHTVDCWAKTNNLSKTEDWITYSGKCSGGILTLEYKPLIGRSTTKYAVCPYCTNNAKSKTVGTLYNNKTGNGSPSKQEHGDGTVTCDDCTDGTKDCAICTDGTVACANCTDGKVNCSTCGGDHLVDCGTCHGSGTKYNGCTSCRGSGTAYTLAGIVQGDGRLMESQGTPVEIILNTTDQSRVFFRTTVDHSDVAHSAFDVDHYMKFEMTGKIAASGDISSLLNADCKVTDLPAYAFYHLFDGCSALQQAPALKFGTLSPSCYEGMFKNCNNLFASPILHATTLVTACYKEMFYGCSNLRSIACNFSAWDPNGTTIKEVDDETGEEKEIFLPSQDNATYHWVYGVYRDKECKFNNEQITDFIYDQNHIPCDDEVQWYAGDDEYLMFTAQGGASYVKLNAIGITDTNLTDKVTPWVKLVYRTRTSRSSSWSSWSMYSFENNGANADGKQINLTDGASVQFRAGSIMDVDAGGTKYHYYYPENNATFSKSSTQYYQFAFQADGGNIVAGGNISSLFSHNGSNDVVPNYAFFRLFYNDHSNCKKLITAPSLPSTKLGQYSYESMFENCMNLQNAPLLPATQLAAHCYGNMFNSCNALISAPDLPASILANYCYYNMFYDCKNLTKAPSLSAVNMANGCYYGMFRGCEKLEKTPILPSKQLASNCYNGMFRGCSLLKEITTNLPAENMVDACYMGMFQGCSSLVSAPDLRATTLATDCYKNMFYGCTNLKKIVVNFTDWSNGTTDWVGGTNFSPSGNFFCPEGLDTEVFSSSRVPKDDTHRWNVIKNPYVTFIALEDGAKVQLKENGTIANKPQLEYSTSGRINDWHTVNFNEDIDMPESGNLVLFRSKVTYKACTGQDNGHNCVDGIIDYGNGTYKTCPTCKGQGMIVDQYHQNESFSKSAADYYQFVASGATTELLGDVASLIHAKTGQVSTVPDDGYTFYGLFMNNRNTKGKADVSFTTLKPHCYQSMFENCESLTSAPNLVANNDQIAVSCYENMFKNCKSITAIPTLNATSGVREACFKGMFMGCSALVDGMPAEFTAVNGQIAQSAYESMFEGCSSLKTAPRLGTQWGLSTNCYKAMFKGCTSLKTSSIISVETFADGAQSSCESMFEGCTSLTTIPEFAMHDYYTYGQGCFKNMFKGCTSLTKTPALIGILNNNCFEGMFENCTSLQSAPALSRISLAPSCYKRMFAGCKSLNSAPELPAATLVEGCYSEMFKGCSNLRYMEVSFTGGWNESDTEDEPSSTYHWVEGVAPAGTFMAPASLLRKYDVSHIPFGWRAEDNGDYFCIYVDGSGYQGLTFTNRSGITLQYSYDKDTWHSYGISDNNSGIHLNNGVNGNCVYFKASNGKFNESETIINEFVLQGNVKVKGNVMSLLDPSMQATQVPAYAFYKMFSNASSSYIQDVSELKLPATTVGDYAYANMFEGCTTVKRSADSAPALPATTLGRFCYENLFAGWTALEKAPELPAKNLVDGCYNGIYNGCGNLQEISVAFNKWLDGATDNWVNEVNDDGEFYCPADLLSDAISPERWGAEDNYANIYGGSKIPKSSSNRWVLILDVYMDFDYNTNRLTLSGGDNIKYLERLSDEPDPTEEEVRAGNNYGGLPVNLSGWINEAKDLEYRKYYAISLISGIPAGICQSIVRDMTIYAYPKYCGYCLADDAVKLKKSLSYAEKTSSANHPVRIFVPDGVYNIAEADKNLVIGDHVSLVGQSNAKTKICGDYADAAPVQITGNYAYLQDMTFMNGNSNGYAFYNQGMYTTLNVAMGGAGGRFMDNSNNVHTSMIPLWTTGMESGEYKPVTRLITNGGAINVVSDADVFLVEMNGDYDLTDCPVFYMTSGTNSTFTVRAANQFGGFGPYFRITDERVTPVLPEDDLGNELTNVSSTLPTVTLNSNGYSSFYYEHDDVTVGDETFQHRLRAIGASAFVAKCSEKFGVVTLYHINDKDVIPSGTGVILFGTPGTTVKFYEDLTSDIDAYHEVLESNQLTGIVENGKTYRGVGSWNTANGTRYWYPNEGDRYYGISGKTFLRLASDGRMKSHKAFFDFGSSTMSSAPSRALRFGRWSDFNIEDEEEEEILPDVTNLHYTAISNKVSPTYNLLGQRTSKLKGLIVKNGKVVMVK